MVKLTNVQGQPVWMNPSQVLYVTPSGAHGGKSLIMLAGGATLHVMEEARVIQEIVQQTLSNAGRR